MTEIDRRKRALQYTLQTLLSDQYSQMRPNNSSTRRKRASQMQRYLELRRSRNKRETCKAKSCPAKTPLARATGSRVEDHNEPIFGTTSKLVDTTVLVEGDQYYLNEFDKLIDAQDQESPLYFNPVGTASPSLDFAVDRAASSSIPREFAPDGPDFHANVLGPNMELDSWKYCETVQTPGRTLSETRGEKQLFESEGDLNLPNIEPAPSNVHHSLGNLSKAGTPLEAVPFRLLASENQSTQIDQQALLSNSPDPPHRLAEPVNHTSDCGVSSHSSVSDLSILVNRLSKCSLGEKQFIKDTLTLFSVSTLSSMDSSHGSGGSVRLAKRLGDPIPFRPARSSNEVLPGDFIISNVNTFWDHIACNQFLASRCDSVDFCESCCLAQVESGTRETWCIPFAVIQAKRNPLVGRIWCDQGNPWWVDRFGNTSLHIAAALGATYQELQAIVDKGASIHVWNSGGQTFMHLLNPLRMDNNSLISLTNHLKRNNFNFNHRDVEGHTFIDSLDLRGLYMLQYAEFWPTSTMYSLRRELYEQGRIARVAPPWLNNWSEVWSYSVYPNLCELLEVPKVVLGRSKHFDDFHGRNYLHIAAGKAETPPKISEQSFMDSRLSLVRDLLSIGVELDHHDNRGETPLMSHIRTQSSQDKTILELLHSGADINSRNKHGETALHISIKLGYIIGTKALLAQGSTVNVHVRNWKGEGVLAVAVRAQGYARDDLGLYAKITTCMVLAIDAGAIMAPTIFDEWDLREPAREALRKAQYIVAPKDSYDS
ncbi:MAG: hypothetical protein L6R36_003285 [Xanthoria steineri]|nr:MAG: hypothetical protein L6R36_003285 [Xanthoria steineri]